MIRSGRRKRAHQSCDEANPCLLECLLYSCHQHLVKFFDDRLQGILAEDAVGDGERNAFIGVDALPCVEVGVLIVCGEGTIEGDVVLDDVEPMALAVVESLAVLGEPLLVAGFHEFGERRERSLQGIDGVADEGDQVRENLDGIRGDGALFEVFVRFPHLGGGDVVGRPADGFSEGFEFFVN